MTRKHPRGFTSPRAPSFLIHLTNISQDRLMFPKPHRFLTGTVHLVDISFALRTQKYLTRSIDVP